MRIPRLLRWSPLVPWTVPRTLTCAPPTGTTWAAPGRVTLVGPKRPAALIRAGDWGDNVAERISGAVLVSATQARVLVLGSLPMEHRLCSKRPLLVHLGPSYRIQVSSAESRTGELWAFPLKHLAAPVAEQHLTPIHDTTF